MKKVLQQPSASIERLLQHGRYLDFLTKRVMTYLPDEFADKISVLGFTSKSTTKTSTNDLIISAISSAWASKLRFYTPTLKRSLIAEPQFSQLGKIIIKVAFSNINTKNKKSTPKYSQNSAKVIESNAEHIENEALKASLMRLSRHVKEKSED